MYRWRWQNEKSDSLGNVSAITPNHTWFHVWPAYILEEAYISLKELNIIQVQKIYTASIIWRLLVSIINEITPYCLGTDYRLIAWNQIPKCPWYRLPLDSMESDSKMSLVKITA